VKWGVLLSDKIDFLKNELKKKGYPLENYVQSMLDNKNWDVYPNSYFLDKDTQQGRELDIKATYETEKSQTWTNIFPRVLIECKKVPGNAWIFFSGNQRPFTRAVHSGLAKWLQVDEFGIFDISSATPHTWQTFATNYCEIIFDKSKSNKRDDNIWKAVITLIKATSQEVEREFVDCCEKYLDDLGTFDKFLAFPSEIVYVFYPIIVFEGEMYEATFTGEDIKLERREYVRLFVDYDSGYYKGQFQIDIINKEKLEECLDRVRKDVSCFDTCRNHLSKVYEPALIEAVKREFEEREYELMNEDT
jgi:hypothetical protein